MFFRENTPEERNGIDSNEDKDGDNNQKTPGARTRSNVTRWLTNRAAPKDAKEENDEEMHEDGKSKKRCGFHSIFEFREVRSYRSGLNHTRFFSRKITSR